MLLLADNLHVSVDGKKVLRGVTLRVERGESVALMGPNGSGKTTFAYTLMGHPKYKAEEGRIYLDGEDVTHLKPYERSLRGMFLSFQSPPEVRNVRLVNLALAAYNKRLGHEAGLLQIYDPKFIPMLKRLAEEVGLGEQMLYRELNVGFSGGEKKRSEVLQAMLIRPKVAVFDEPDSGLDADGLAKLGSSLKRLLTEGVGILLITHYTRIFRHVDPDRIYVMVGGRIVDEGDVDIAKRIDEVGYKAYFSH